MRNGPVFTEFFEFKLKRVETRKWWWWGEKQNRTCRDLIGPDPQVGVVSLVLLPVVAAFFAVVLHDEIPAVGA